METQDHPVEEAIINFCPKVEFHVLDMFDLSKRVVPLALEHGFGGICVFQSRVAEFKKQIGVQDDSYEKTKLVSLIDYPFGASSTDSRIYQIRSSKEAGADAVEIIAPYSYLAQKNSRAAVNDLESIVDCCIECKVGLRYVIDVNSEFVTKDALGELGKSATKRKQSVTISTSSGFFDGKKTVTDIVMWLRDIKKIFGTRVKTYISNCDPTDFSTVVKAGSDIIGLEWEKAPSLVHAYEELIREATQKS